MKKVITIQHPRSVHHTNKMVGSWTNWSLTNLGLKQAKAIAVNIKTELQNANATIFSSDLLRTKQTAEIIAEELNFDIVFTDVLRERNLGKAVGKSVEWLRQNIECQEQTIDDKMFSNAESRREVWNRLLPFYQKILQSKEELAIIVSHGDTLSVFNAMWLGLPVEALNTCNMHGKAGGVSFMHINNQQKRIIQRLSDMSYIK